MQNFDDSLYRAARALAAKPNGTRLIDHLAEIATALRKGATVKEIAAQYNKPVKAVRTFIAKQRIRNMEKKHIFCANTQRK